MPRENGGQHHPRFRSGSLTERAPDSQAIFYGHVEIAVATHASSGEPATPTANPSSAVDEVRRRIAALKVRKPVIELTPQGFRFDPSEPLRLKKPDKK
jgi:hypothetical protein